MGRSVEGSIFSRGINISRPSDDRGALSQRGGLPPRTLEVHESSKVEHGGSHIVVRLSGSDSKQFGLPVPVILYKRHS